MDLSIKLINRLLLSLSLILIFVSSCGGYKQKKSEAKPLKFSAITRKICTSDTTQSYNVYLPIGYPGQKKWPVIYAFDPHGDGKLAVNHFQKAAERYGYIILGSNNSRNGLQTLDHTLAIFLSDTKNKFAIDPDRQYATGFSGGGRVAGILATKYGNIKGIITCSAGLPGLNPQTSPTKFDIYAIAGREDFNYDEVMSIQQQFSNTNWRFITTAFDGGHTWPPASYLSNAVSWFQLNAMKDGAIPKDEDMLDLMLDSFKIRSQQYLSNNHFIRAADECKMGISYLTGLLSTKKLETKLREIQTQEGYTNELHSNEQLQLMEQQLKRGYIQGFSNQDIDWWKNELNDLTNSINQGADLGTRQMYSRIKGFLGIVCYSYSSKAIQENNMDMAAKCLEIYETLEPKNPDCFYYKAQFLDKKGQNAEAATSLKKAVEFGFKEMSKAHSQLSKKTIEIFELSFK